MKQSAKNLTEGSIFGNLIKLSLPIMLSNFVQVFYNLTDTFWLGKLGEKAKEAVAVTGLAFPLVFFISSFAVGFTIAGTALISRAVGEKNMEKVKLVAGQFFIITVLCMLTFAVLGYTCLEPILKFLDTPDEIFADASKYILIILNGMIFMFVFLSYQSGAHGVGDTWSPMIIQLISISINFVLDPLMIFGLGFFPRLEIYGAGYATLIARISASILALWFLHRRNRILIPHLSDLRPRLKLMMTILKIAIPASVSQSITSFGFILLQGFVNTFGTVVMSAYSICNRMIGFFMMPAMGISNALATIVGQNLGAENVTRAKHSFHVALMAVLGFLGLGGIILFTSGTYLTQFFINDPEVVAIGHTMFRIVSPASVVFGIVFVLWGVFNGSGYTLPVMVINITRLWVLRIPLTYIISGKASEVLERYSFSLPSFMNSFVLESEPYNSLWYAMLISNVVTAFLGMYLYFKGKWKHVKHDY